MSECNHDCSSCTEKCNDRTSFLATPKETTSIKKMVAVVSGKGGVGKSFVSSLLASCANKKGLKTGIMDVDITGPSIPKAFGFTGADKALGDESGIYPVTTASGISVMSINLLLEEETSPVIWRGPVISGVVKQFYTDVYWDERDIIFVDMPPGTGDVPLTVFQSLPIDGIIVVTTPQDLAGMIVVKAVNMANMMNIPILGIVENMSYMVCPGCGEKLYPFGEGKAEEIAKEFNLDVLAKLPIDGNSRKLVDEGKVEEIDSSVFNGVIDKIMEIKK